jgi:hypothetical protein
MNQISDDQEDSLIRSSAAPETIARSFAFIGCSASASFVTTPIRIKTINADGACGYKY